MKLTDAIQHPQDAVSKIAALTARNAELTEALMEMKVDWSIYQFYRPELREKVDALLAKGVLK